MAVQQNKTSHRRTHMRRAHHALAAPALSVDSTTGETHLRHHITPEGYYRGEKILEKIKGMADYSSESDED